MSAAILDVLKRFNSLSPEERYECSAAILNQSKEEYGDLSELDYTALADELFQQYDREEEKNACSTS